MRPSRADKNDPKLAVLRDVPGLSGLPPRELLSLASLFDEARLDEGDVLTREGETGRELFLIADGEVVVSLRGDDVATVGAGEFVGEMALFDRAPRSATVTALTPLHVLVAGAGSFGTLLAHPAVVRRLAMTLAGRLRAAQGSPEHWSAGYPPSAVA